MKRLIVKACGNSPLEDIRASIEARVPYAQFYKSLESFRILSFDIPDENIDQVKGNVNDCGHKCFWDTTIELDPVVEEEGIDIEKLIQERNEARAAKDFQKADDIRNKLNEMGIEIEDTADGIVWSSK